MDRLMLSQIDEELESSEVAALVFLCRDVIPKKHLEMLEDAKGLFLRLEKRGLLENDLFLSQLLRTISRHDLLNLLETDSRPTGQTHTNVNLSDFRVMLYKIYDDMSKEDLEKLKFLLNSKVSRGKLELCKTALDVFTEMEKVDLLSNTNLGELHQLLREINLTLASIVERYMEGMTTQDQRRSHQRINNPPQPIQDMPETQHTPSGEGQSICSDAEASAPPNETKYYEFTHNPRGVCMVINNEEFLGSQLRNRAGTEQDEKALQRVFGLLGFTVVVHNNLTAADMRHELNVLGKENFMDHDALVVCVLSHGEKRCVYGTDEKPVTLRELTRPFTSDQAPTLAGKPKLFFIQACQGSGYQGGSVPCPPRPGLGGPDRQSRLEEDAGPVQGETVPWDADFLLGMATVPDCKSFRNTSTGSIYIQELCKQLTISATSSENDDIHTVLTNVNSEVSKRNYSIWKQMPQPEYTLTKKLVLKSV